MDTLRAPFRPELKRSERRTLGKAVRRALQVGTGVIAAGLSMGAVAAATDAVFPAIFPLKSLLLANGGDGSTGFALNGVVETGNAGSSVSAAGDVNHDGIGDVIIGAPAAGSHQEGESYIVFGRDTSQTGNFPAELALSSLRAGDGSTGFVVHGIQSGSGGDFSGTSVSNAGDVNSDGIDDVLIGAGKAEVDDRLSTGETYVIFGRDVGQTGDFPPVIELVNLVSGDGSTGFALSGVAEFDYSGSVVSTVGDLNADGIDDIVIGANGADRPGEDNAGASYVVFGRDTAQTGEFPPRIELSRLATGDGSLGFVLYGIEFVDASGTSVDTAGDINGDGIVDLLVGASGVNVHARENAGETYVIYGRDTAQTGNFPAQFELSTLANGDGSAGFAIRGIKLGDKSGWRASVAGDVNGDGIDDIVIGAPQASRHGRGDVGEAYVLFGRDAAQAGNFPAVVSLASLLAGDGSAGFVIAGLGIEDGAGASVSAAGDVNGDGIADVLVGAPGGACGKTFVLFGRDTAQTGNFPARFALASLLPSGGGDGTEGFMLVCAGRDDNSGAAVSSAGDVNGDGIDDLLIGAGTADLGGEFSVGQSYVVFGRAAGTLGLR